MADEWIDEIRRTKQAERERAAREVADEKARREIFAREGKIAWGNVRRELKSLAERYNAKVEQSAQLMIKVVSEDKFEATWQGQLGVEVYFDAPNEQVLVSQHVSRNRGAQPRESKVALMVQGGAVVIQNNLGASELARQILQPLFEAID